MKIKTNNPKLETKNFITLDGFKFEEKVIDNEKYFTFEGYILTFGNVDLGNDVCVAGCTRETLKKRKPKLLNQHNWDEPIGVFDTITEDQKGVFVTARMPLSDKRVSDFIIPQMKIGSIDSMSIGYRTKVSRYDEDKDIRYLEEIELYEASIVTIPMNPMATITGMKSLEGDCKEMALLDYKWNPEEAKTRIKENDIGLDVVDVIDGKTLVIPRALFCLKAQLCGAKRGFNGDTTFAMEFLNKYYEKLELDKPFKTNDIKEVVFSEIELKNLPKSEMSYVIRNCMLSKNCGDYLADIVGTAIVTAEKSDETESVKDIIAGLNKVKQIYEK